MRPKSLAKSVVVAFVSIALAVPGCVVELQKKYSSFDNCFREEKKAAMAVGVIAGAIAGVAVANSRKKDETANNATRDAAVGVALAAMGAIVGNRIAWQRCGSAFAGKVQTSVLNDRAAAVTQGGLSPTQAAVKSLAIQGVNVSPMVFGKDIEVSVTYRYISDKPTARDIKAQVTRGLMFKSPDGASHDTGAKSDEVIQQGISRSTFSIPTPSLADAEELKYTTNWALKFVVEVEGERQEKVVPLNVPQLSGGTASGRPNNAITSTATTIPSRPAGNSAGETLSLRQGTTLFRAADSSTVAMQLTTTQSVIVLQRIVQGSFNWTQVRLPDGREGWLRGARR